MLPPTPLATNTAAAAEQHRHHTDGNTTAACQRIPGPNGTGAQAMPRSAGSAREYNGGPATLPCRGEATTRTRRDDLPPAADLPSLGACEGRKTQKGKGGGSNVSCGTTVYPQRQANPHGRTAPAAGTPFRYSFIVIRLFNFIFFGCHAEIGVPGLIGLKQTVCMGRAGVCAGIRRYGQRTSRYSASESEIVGAGGCRCGTATPSSLS